MAAVRNSDTGPRAIPTRGFVEDNLPPVANVGENEQPMSRPTGPAVCGTHPLLIPSLRPAGVAPAGNLLPPADTLEEPIVVDVLFLYTPQAITGEGDEEGIRGRVLDSVAETNHRFTNSLINVRIEPVFIGRVDYTESGDISTDLNRLAAGTTGFSGVSTLRQDYKADLVCLITELENKGVAGQAYDIPNSTGNASGAFAAIRRVALGRGNMLLAHELGHLFGCAHDREHAGDVNSSFYRDRRPYIFGHRFAVEGVTYVDVMSYEPGIYVPYFSNPRLDLDGVPMGIASGTTRPSDGARTINETAPYVARYRNARSRIEFVRTNTVASEEAGSMVVQLRRSGDLETSTAVTVAFSKGGTATAGADFTPEVAPMVNFATNQSIAEVVIQLVDDGEPEAPEILRLALRSVQGEHGVGIQGTSEILITDRTEQILDSQIRFPDGEVAVLDTESECRVPVRFTGDLPGPGEEPAIVAYRTRDGTALAGQDYQSVSGFLTNGPGRSEWMIPIPILPLPEAGPDRSFSLVVGGKTNTIRIVDAQRPGAPAPMPGVPVESDGYWSAWLRGDGSRLIWGSFSRIQGIPRDSVALLKPDGSLDESFQPPEILLGHRRMDGLGAGVWSWYPFPRINVVLPQSDGRILVAGGFSRVGGQPRNTLVRLLANGALDPDFGRELAFDGQVFALVIQPDGRIVVGGSFEKINGVRRAFVARLMPNGTVDASFQPKGGLASSWTVWVEALALQPDGGILVGGAFERVDGVGRLNLARLLPNGTLDTQFKARSGASGVVRNLRLQADGRILVAGAFDALNGRTSKKLGRLLADGSNDTGFLPPNPDAEVLEAAPLPDGRLLIQGLFSKVANTPRPYFALLAADGSLDTTTDLGSGPAGPMGSLRGVADPDGWLQLTGGFRKFNGLPAANEVRIRLGELAPAFGLMEWRDGGLSAQLHGITGATYRLESSPDFQRWEPAGSVHLEGYESSAELSFPADGGGNRFLRAVPGLP